MKQLVILRETPNVQSEPPYDQILDTLQRTAAYMDELVKAGKGESPMFFTNVNGGGMIIEADTADEINSIIESVPIRPICTVETYTISAPADFLAALTNAPSPANPASPPTPAPAKSEPEGPAGQDGSPPEA